MSDYIQTELALIPHTYAGELIQQRSRDGYVNATALCKAANKLLGHYRQDQTTKDFLDELVSVIGIPITELIQIHQGEISALQGTWVHPQVAIHLAQWLSPAFAVRVTQWVYDWMSGLGPEHGAWQIFQERICLVYDNVPIGYWCIFKETADIYATMIRNGAHMGAKMILDISIGYHWGMHWRENSFNEKYGDRHHYPHDYPVSYPQAKSNPQMASCYPDSSWPEFKRWMREDYLPKKLPEYLRGLVRKGKLQTTAANDALEAIEYHGKGRVRVKGP